jgi:hypothetical protein
MEDAMADDYENVLDLEDLSDRELHTLILEHFRGTPDVDFREVDIDVEEGEVTLSGRVGTEREYQIFEHVVTDVLGVSSVTNELVVDALVRGSQSEAADVAVNRRMADTMASDGVDDDRSDSADHLADDVRGEQYGTTDVSEAIERGFSYNPPDGPIQEGSESRERH